MSESDKSRIKKCEGISITHNGLSIEKKFIDDSASAIRSLVEFIGRQLDGAIDRTLQPQRVKQAKP